MTLVGDLKLWDIGAVSPTTVDLSATAAIQVTSTTHMFANTDKLLVDGGIFRFQFSASGSDGRQVKTYLRDPAFGGTPTFFQGQTLKIATSGTVSSNINSIIVLKNTATKIQIRVILENGNHYTISLLSGIPVVEVDYFRGPDLTQSAFIDFGYDDSSLRWTLSGNGDIIRDDILQAAASQSQATGRDIWRLGIDPNKNWLYGFMIENSFGTTEKTDTLFVGRMSTTAAAIPNVSRKGWYFFLPTREPVSDGGTTTMHLTKSAVAKDSTWAITFQSSGYYQFAIVPTAAGTYSTVAVEAPLGTNVLSASNLAQNVYATTRLAKITTGSVNVRVNITDTDATASYVLVWWPVMPSDATEIDNFSAFPGYVANLALSNLFIKEDIVND